MLRGPLKGAVSLPMSLCPISLRVSLAVGTVAVAVLRGPLEALAGAAYGALTGLVVSYVPHKTHVSHTHTHTRTLTHTLTRIHTHNTHTHTCRGGIHGTTHIYTRSAHIDLIFVRVKHTSVTHHVTWRAQTHTRQMRARTSDRHTRTHTCVLGNTHANTYAPTQHTHTAHIDLIFVRLKHMCGTHTHGTQKYTHTHTHTLWSHMSHTIRDIFLETHLGTHNTHTTQTHTQKAHASTYDTNTHTHTYTHTSHSPFPLAVHRST